MTDKLTLYRRSRLTETGCWEWIGARTTAGYGEINRKRRVRYVHRIAWELHHGPIPAGKWVLHRCDNPPCWNPDHLFLGTHRDNVADKMLKGRHRHGHLYGDDHPTRKRPEIVKRGEHHGMARLTWDIVRQIRACHAAGEIKARIADRFSVNRGTVFKVVNNQQWKE